MVASDVSLGVAASIDRGPLWNRVKPPIYRGLPYIRIVLVLAALLLYRATRTQGRAQEQLFNTWMLYTMLVIGFYFVFGISGQFAFSQASIYGLGGYVSAWATHNHDHPLLLGLGAAVVVCLAVSLLFSLVMQRTEHFYFAVGTLGLQNVILTVVTQWKGLSRGSGGGEVSDIRHLSVFGHTLATRFDTFKLLLFALGLAMVVAVFLERSPIRREAIANRDSPVVARTLGLPALKIRVTMFMLGSFFAAVAGSLNAHSDGSLGPTSFGVDLGLFIFLMVILGGLGSFWGAILGAWFFVYVRYQISISKTHLFGDKLSAYLPAIFGIVLILVMIFLPDGILGLGTRVRRIFRKDTRALAPNWLALLLGFARPPQPVVGAMPSPHAGSDIAPAPPPRGAPLIEADDVSVSFGGVKAVDAVSITLYEREILGLIGPNGSGKSTVVNAIPGVVPASGSLRIRGTEIALGHPGSVRSNGVLRTYQTPQTFLHLTCIENVMLTTTDRKYTGIVSSVVLRPLMLRHEKQRWRDAASALDRVGLLDRAEDSAANLSYGQQRLLELARTLAGQPTVVLLDEPSAGLNASETEVLANHLRQMRNDGVSLLVIDHKIDFITALVDRVVVLELGQLVAEGEPRTIWQDVRVQNAYLGVADDEDE